MSDPHMMGKGVWPSAGPKHGSYDQKHYVLSLENLINTVKNKEEKVHHNFTTYK